MTTMKVNTCIVGGGPAGLMLGLLLAKRGVDVLVLEGHETFAREFRGEVLQPSTAQLLDELGLLDYIQREPHSRFDEGVVRMNGKAIGGFSFKKTAVAVADALVVLRGGERQCVPSVHHADETRFLTGQEFLHHHARARAAE